MTLLSSPGSWPAMSCKVAPSAHSQLVVVLAWSFCSLAHHSIRVETLSLVATVWSMRRWAVIQLTTSSSAGAGQECQGGEPRVVPEQPVEGGDDSGAESDETVRSRAAHFRVAIPLDLCSAIRVAL